MATVSKRRGKWVLDYRVHGRRIWRTYQTKAAASAALAVVLSEQKQAQDAPRADPFVRLADYAPRFLAVKRIEGAAPGTLARLRSSLDRHILPCLGAERVRDLTRRRLRAFLETKRTEPSAVQGIRPGEVRTPTRVLSPGSVRNLRMALSGLLELAVDDGIILANPTRGVERRSRTRAAREVASAQVKALTPDQLAALFEAASGDDDLLTACHLMALCGLRAGEALGLRWCNVDLEARSIRVVEQYGSASTKTGASRTVDLSEATAEHLRARRPSDDQERVVGLDRLAHPGKALRSRFSAAVRSVGLPEHLTPHACRHTFATLLLVGGASPVYVQQQLGHRSIDLTVRVYGSWLPTRAPGAVDRLAGLVVGKLANLVAK